MRARAPGMAAPRSTRLEHVLDVVHDEITSKFATKFERNLLSPWSPQRPPAPSRASRPSQGMMRLAQTSKTIHSIVCARALEFSRECHDETDADRVVAHLQRCAGLRRVQLHGVFGADVMLAIAARCTSLRSLFLHQGFMGVTDNGIAAVVRVHTGIVELTLKSLHDFTDSALQSIAQHLPQLELLVLDDCIGITNVGVSKLVRSCTALKKIDLRFSPVGGAAVAAIANNCPLLHTLYLATRGTSHLLTNGPDTQLDEGIAALARGCPVLRHLDLSRATITDAALSSLASGECPLEYLRLFDCPNVSDAGLAALLPKWRTTRLVLIIQGSYQFAVRRLSSTRVTVASVFAIAAQVPNARQLHIEVEVTDEALYAVAHGCPNLSSFGFNWLSLVSESMVVALGISHPKFMHSARDWETGEYIGVAPPPNSDSEADSDSDLPRLESESRWSS